MDKDKIKIKTDKMKPPKNSRFPSRNLKPRVLYLQLNELSPYFLSMYVFLYTVHTHVQRTHRKYRGKGEKQKKMRKP